ncbi:hypothetical protein V6R21_22365 [Limibacter armeniacum]|uniref:hypothetical protein n=1 Tax=Limibacter armeniacum TaxID=466084 RepID=UPI002FE648FD
MISKYLLVISLSMFKFIFGPITSLTLGFSLVEGIILTVVGMMMTVLLLIILGPRFRNKLYAWMYKKKRRRLFTPRNRKIVTVWRKHGLLGVAFLTPVLLTPVGGALVAIAFGEKKSKIFWYMLASAFTWSIILNTVIFLAGEELGILDMIL